MKKIYSILALALALGVGQVNAMVSQDEKGNVIAEGNVSVAEINAEITDLTPEVDVTGVTSDISSSQIEVINPNTLIIVKSVDQVANTVNVVYQDPYNNSWKTNKFVIKDGYSFLSTRKFDAAEASYERKVKYEYNTMALPFSFKAEKQSNGLKFEILKEVSEDLLTFEQITNTEYGVVTEEGEKYHHIASGTPMIVHLHDFAEGNSNKIVIISKNATINGDEQIVYPNVAYKLSGSYNDKYIGKNETGIAYIQHNSFWIPSDFDDEIIVPAYRCTLDLSTSSPAAKSFRIVSLDNETTAINNISAKSATNSAYNLQGVRVAADTKGFVIMNGKKYFNK